MESEYGCCVLMLVYVDENWMDIGGNTYPIEGFVEAKEFTKDLDIRFGLYGIMWGKTSYFPYEQAYRGNWIVVKTEISEDIIKVDWHYNRHKFYSGSVVYSGNLRDAAMYIIEHKNDSEFSKDGQWIQPEEIAGSEEWLKEHGLIRN